MRRRLVLLCALAVLALAGATAAVLAGRDDRSSSDAELLASADRDLDPMLAPRRRRPQVVEPEAGDPEGDSAPDQGAPPPPRGKGDDEGSGPSSGAPPDAEVRQQVTRLKEASRRYRFDELDFSGQLIPFDALPSDGWRTSVASVYYDFGLGLACGGLLRPEQLGVAHKTAPCGTLITFRYGNRAIRVPVIDRGPYIVGREWDFTAATAVALGFPGLGPVEWRVSS